MTAPARRRRRAGRGALAFIALAFAISGTLRLSLGFDKALALVPAAVAAIGEPVTCPEPPTALIEALQLREDRVARWESTLEERMVALALADQAISARLIELTNAETALSATLAQADGAAESDLSRLTTVYETMKPKDATALFDTMATEFAAGFLGRMRPASAAAILAGMSPQAAYAVSVLLASRNAMVPKE